MKNKELALPDFLALIHQSWTWERLTEEERNRCGSVLSGANLRGNYRARYNQLNDMYGAFLCALGYQPVGWREPETGEPAPLF